MLSLTLSVFQVFIGFVLKQFEYIEVGQFRYAGLAGSSLSTCKGTVTTKDT